MIVFLYFHQKAILFPSSTTLISGPVVMSGLYLNHTLIDSYIIIIDLTVFGFRRCLY